MAGAKYPEVVVLCADVTESLHVTLFRDTYPKRFIEVGVAEQNMASVASGLAAMGKIPFIASYAIFSPGRNWEQIRTTICYNDMPVKIIGSHAGVTVGPDGGSHQMLEDIALMRALPRMTILSPSDANEARSAALLAAAIDGPVYIRLPRIATPVITSPHTKYPFPVMSTLWFPSRKGESDVGIIATGTMVHQALLAAAALEKQGFSATVVNAATLKPLDENGIERLARETGALVTAEEHQMMGGLGSAVAEVVVRRRLVPMEFVGVDDEFGQSGTPDELLKEYHLTAADIVKASLRVIARKPKTKK